MKLKVKSKYLKKVICISLIGGMAVCFLTACHVQSKDKEVVTLQNQQEEIQDVLPIKKMDTIENFEGLYWLDNGDILGTYGNTYTSEKKYIPNICIYDAKNKQLKTLSHNKENGKIFVQIKGIIKDERYVVYDKCVLVDDPFIEDYKRDTYIIDLKNKTEKKIDEKADCSTLADGNKIIISKGLNLYMYDLGGNKTEIKLPDEMIKEMSDFSKLSFEEYLEWHFSNKAIDEKTNKDMKKRYKFEKENNKILFANKKGDEVYIETYNRIPFSYNLKNNTYKKLTKEEKKKFHYNHKQYNDDVVKLEKNNEGIDELWELDLNKKHKKLIVKGKLSRNITVSPDCKKVVYCSYGEKGEKSTFVYDLETGKKVKIFRKITSLATWDKSSKQFFIPSTNNSIDKDYYHETSIVTLY